MNFVLLELIRKQVVIVAEVFDHVFLSTNCEFHSFALLYSPTKSQITTYL